MPGWKSIFLRGLWDAGTLWVKGRHGAAPGSAPAQQGEPGASPGCTWFSVVREHPKVQHASSSHCPLGLAHRVPLPPVW